ncbi:hypothetical protein HK405_005717 [Cladochytrium tenue]|nr:hypothetical protein HK405_005717 [Cladochytrium tenue]
MSQDFDENPAVLQPLSRLISDSNDSEPVGSERASAASANPTPARRLLPPLVSRAAGARTGAGGAGQPMCEHGRRRAQCLACHDLGVGGGSICAHRRRKDRCGACRAARRRALATPFAGSSDSKVTARRPTPLALRPSEAPQPDLGESRKPAPPPLPPAEREPDVWPAWLVDSACAGKAAGLRPSALATCASDTVAAAMLLAQPLTHPHVCTCACGRVFPPAQSISPLPPPSSPTSSAPAAGAMAVAREESPAAKRTPHATPFQFTLAGLGLVAAELPPQLPLLPADCAGIVGSAEAGASEAPGDAGNATGDGEGNDDGSTVSDRTPELLPLSPPFTP